MGKEESAAVFDSHNLNPKLFVNEVLNSVDDLVDGAFDFCLQQAPEVVGGTTDTNRSEELNRGVSTIRNSIQAVLDKRLSAWENYCLQNCFVVPERFSLQAVGSSDDAFLPQDGLNDTDLDIEIQSLRDKLAIVGRESAELQRQVQALEKQSVLVSNYDSTVADALKLYEENSVRVLLEEIQKAAPTLHLKVQELKLRREDLKQAEAGHIFCPSKEHYMECDLGLHDLQEVTELLKNN